MIRKNSKKCLNFLNIKKIKKIIKKEMNHPFVLGVLKKLSKK